jgi:hypothetical protein
MKTRVAVWLILCISICASKVKAQWPMDLTSPKGAFITIYQPQLESFEGNKLKGRAAFSVKEKSTDEPLFGVIWFTASMETDRDTRMASLVSIIIDNIKLPDVTDESKISKLKALLEEEIPKWELTASMEEITASIENEQQTSGTEELKNDPPKIIYKEQATTLIFIDGEPKIEKDDKLNMNRVINTAFLIVQNPDDKKYYLYGGTYWYVSGQVKEGWAAATNLPKTISSLDSQIKKQEKESGKKPAEKPANPPALVVSTVPSELIQSDGKASFANIDGTNLLYVSNSEDNIFKSVDDQAYYVLISGRWYSSPALDGSWKYISADKLPADFAKIPVGSEKDNVLSSVPGTDAAKDAVMDAQIPQTAKVDRQKATCTVEYNGEPKFEKIDGTSLELAMNTSSTVLRSGKKYYCVENGVWFVADNAKGPWKVSDERPEDVEDIPASSSAYNTKYVYVYESTPEVVYVGYTPGYMGCYVYGPTVVYGTGYYYSPWYGPYYYPRPVTYGFSMHYNPWCGWSMGFHFSVGFFSFHSYGYGGYGGYWGPPMYRPPYYPPYHGGMYGGRGPTYINNDIDINIDNSNNIYNRRNDVSTRDISRGDRQGSRPTAGQQPTSRPGASTQPSNRPTTGQQPSNRPGASTQPSTGKTKPSTQPRPSTTPTTKQTPSASTSQNNVYADRNGNVYQRNDNGSWDQRSNNQWQSSSNNMNSSYQSRERSTQANRSYSQMQGGGNMGGASRPSTSSRPSGGGMRGGGGRRG